jgi:hypothetical protein
MHVPDFIFISVISFDKTSLNSTKITKGSRYNGDQLNLRQQRQQECQHPKSRQRFCFRRC